MSEILAQLEKKGGGDLKETTLWTNSNPTSSFPGGYNTTFSESIENFKYIKIYNRLSTSNATEVSTIYEKDMFKTLTAFTTNGACGAISTRQGNTNYFRRLTYVSATEMLFMDALNAVGSTSNSFLIPTKVCGLK